MKKPAREALDAYYREAGSWASDQADSLRKSRQVAWIVAGAAVAVAVAEGFALMLLAPLKTVEPYTLLVDRTTGFVEALKPLDQAQITPDKALVQSMLVQYVIGREGFDMATLQTDYRKIGLWSAGQARTDYLALMQPSNLDGPLVQYGRTTVVETRVKSVSPLDARSALVRFETVRRDEGGADRDPQAWVAVIEYGFSGKPMSVEDRYVNPLGFQVTKYRKDPEALEPAPPAAPARIVQSPDEGFVEAEAVEAGGVE